MDELRGTDSINPQLLQVLDFFMILNVLDCNVRIARSLRRYADWYHLNMLEVQVEELY